MDKEAVLREIDQVTAEADAINGTLDSTLERLRSLVRTARDLDVSQAELARRSHRHRNTIKIWCKD